MRCASIDLGTNTALLLIADVRKEIDDVLDIARITRLGEGVKKNGYLLPQAMDRALTVLKEYGSLIEAHHVDRVFCVGTSALREAQNGPAFLDRVERECGIKIEIITGEDEAYYTYLSVREGNLSGENLFSVVDIGGGSTEIISGSRDRLIDYRSVPVGTVKLTEMFIHHDPASKEEIDALRDHLRALLSDISDHGQGILIGTGGTVTNLAVINLGLDGFEKETVHGSRLSLSGLTALIDEMESLTNMQRSRMKGMERGREDLIVQGAILLEELMVRFGFSSCIADTRGVRYGVILHRCLCAG